MLLTYLFLLLLSLFVVAVTTLKQLIVVVVITIVDGWSSLLSQQVANLNISHFPRLGGWILHSNIHYRDYVKKFTSVDIFLAYGRS